MQTGRGFLRNARRCGGHCVWLNIIATFGESTWRTSGCICRSLRERWYLKLFKRLLNSTVLSSITVYRQVTERNKEQLSYRIQLVEEMFMKHAHAAGEQSVLGQLAPNNTIPRLTKRNFLRKVAPKTERSKSQRRCVMCVRAEKKNLQGTAVKYVMWAFV